jgi:hypothetical protein
VTTEEEPVGDAVVDEVLRLVDRAMPFTTVTSTSSDVTTWFSQVDDLARRGEDPLAPWRDGLRVQMEHRHGVAVPRHVPAAFVLQWWCEVAAVPTAYPAVLGEHLLEPASHALGFELAPGLDPYRVVVDPRGTAVAVEPDPENRLGGAREVYGSLVGDVVAGFAPEVRMGSRQRWGVVDDTWATAVRLARGAAGQPTGPEPRRRSCCFIYVLPGMRECAACPRGGVPARHRN